MIIFLQFYLQTRKSNPCLSRNLLGANSLLHRQLNVTSLTFASRSLSSLGNQSDNLAKVIADSPQNVIDLTETSNQELVQSVVNLINQPVTEVSVTALGLASNYTPIGWCLHFLDFLHSAFPWWGSIAVATLFLRLSVFPIIISSQRTAAKLNEVLPEQAKLKEKMNQARLVGDTVEFAKLANESHTLFNRHNVNPIKAMLAPLAQIPVFLTFFLTLRRMANYPVESLKTGGFLWVTDMSIPDPLFILPVITSLTLWATMEISFRSGKWIVGFWYLQLIIKYIFAGLNPNQTAIFKYGARIIPFVALIFTYNFPAVIMTYWCTNNFLSVVQVIALKQPAVRTFLNIPQIKVNPMKLDVNKKSFTKRTHVYFFAQIDSFHISYLADFKETIENAKINKIIEERKTIDEITFKKAGIGPMKKTYKQDPTRVEN